MLGISLAIVCTILKPKPKINQLIYFISAWNKWTRSTACFDNNSELRLKIKHVASIKFEKIQKEYQCFILANASWVPQQQILPLVARRTKRDKKNREPAVYIVVSLSTSNTTIWYWKFNKMPFSFPFSVMKNTVHADFLYWLIHTAM